MPPAATHCMAAMGLIRSGRAALLVVGAEKMTCRRVARSSSTGRADRTGSPGQRPVVPPWPAVLPDTAFLPAIAVRP
ncbi:hypothetical protein GCM10011588_71030 [Nocardia jinanensis]|uniref:Uncharacterized protein n=1 Tax=Nocardia jinanensis TaxID=382504 RepID=A0A917RYY7_9NOCA|nr:hypothetical protein GCM10011588_71030 [Nocardia jinanensis]